VEEAVAAGGDAVKSLTGELCTAVTDDDVGTVKELLLEPTALAVM